MSCGTGRRAGATVIFAYGEWYCYAVIFGLRRVVFATQVWEANIIPLRPSGAISLLLATISRWHSQHITSNLIWHLCPQMQCLSRKKDRECKTLSVLFLSVRVYCFIADTHLGAFLWSYQWTCPAWPVLARRVKIMVAAPRTISPARMRQITLTTLFCLFITVSPMFNYNF